VKPILKAALFFVVIGLGVLLFKAVQKQCWDRQISLFAPPSLGSWDPTERIEAARQAARKYGGKP
jgi:hypothetical protein